jgi:hypothetical protein
MGGRERVVVVYDSAGGLIGLRVIPWREYWSDDGFDVVLKNCGLCCWRFLVVLFFKITISSISESLAHIVNKIVVSIPRQTCPYLNDTHLKKRQCTSPKSDLPSTPFIYLWYQALNIKPVVRRSR